MLFRHRRYIKEHFRHKFFICNSLFNVFAAQFDAECLVTPLRQACREPHSQLRVANTDIKICVYLCIRQTLEDFRFCISTIGPPIALYGGVAVSVHRFIGTGKAVGGRAMLMSLLVSPLSAVPTEASGTVA